MPSVGRRFVPFVLAALGCGDAKDVSLAAPPSPNDAPAATLARPDVGKAADRTTAGGTRDDVQQASARPSFQPGPSLPSQMVIRTGRVSIEVDSLDRAIRVLGDLAADVGGYLANTAIRTGQSNTKSATLEIKVPADRYQGALDRLASVGKVISSETNAQDVGEEYVDVTARVTNARRLEDRLLNLLATRTGKLDDVLSVERELARVREEIERFEGRLRFLKSQVAMSTLTVTVYEPGPIVGNPGSNVLLEAVKESWRNFVSVVATGIAAAGGLLPVAGLAGLGWLVVRRWRRRRSAPVPDPSPAA